MHFYKKELQALERAGRYRKRRVFDNDIIDLASNDYLGFAEDKRLLDQAYKLLEPYEVHAPKASMLVNGYHPLHQQFEKRLCELNGFEDGIIVGSGFSANIAMIEALVRKGDTLFIDSLYHASGQLASQLSDGEVVVFEHNRADILEALLQKHPAKRQIIAIEGIYSMDGDLCNPEIIALANRHNAIVIVDEAHSSGVVGENLLGVLDHFHIQVTPNIIKMGTLGKAYGSFGAYILASQHIIDFLINRAKPVIYATAPSLFDTALGLVALEKIVAQKELLKEAITKRQTIVKEQLEIAVPGLIVPIVFGDNKKVLAIQQRLLEEKLLVGAIRQPTVDKAIIRLIARIGVSEENIHKTCTIVSSFR